MARQALIISMKSNADDYAMTMRVRAAAFTKTCQETGDEIGRIALERAQWWSSGPFKQKQLTQWGHPYSRDFPFSVGEGYPARINVQTGQFKAGWTWSHVRPVGTGDMVGTLTNTSNRTRWLTKIGTRRMIGRPVREAIRKDVRKQTPHLYAKIWPTTIKVAGGPVRAIGGGRMGGVNLAAAFNRGFQRGVNLGTMVGGI